MKKDKGVAIASPSDNVEDELDEEDNEEGSAPFPAPAPAKPARISTRNASSKYDFVKVLIF